MVKFSLKKKYVYLLKNIYFHENLVSFHFRFLSSLRVPLLSLFLRYFFVLKILIYIHIPIMYLHILRFSDQFGITTKMTQSQEQYQKNVNDNQQTNLPASVIVFGQSGTRLVYLCRPFAYALSCF